MKLADRPANFVTSLTFPLRPIDGSASGGSTAILDRAGPMPDVCDPAPRTDRQRGPVSASCNRDGRV